MAQEPFLLEYARFHGLAIPPSIEHAEPYKNNESLILPEQPSSSKNSLSPIQSQIERSIRKEKLNVKKEGAQILSTVLRDAKRDKIHINWDEILPARIERFRVDPPLRSDHDADIVSVKRYKFLRIGDDALPVKDGERLLDSGIDPTANLLRLAREIKHTMSERLACTKDILLRIQNTRKASNISVKDVIKPLGDLGLGQFNIIKSEDSLLSPLTFEDTPCGSPSHEPSNMLPGPISPDFKSPFRDHPDKDVLYITSSWNDCGAVDENDINQAQQAMLPDALSKDDTENEEQMLRPLTTTGEDNNYETIPTRDEGLQTDQSRYNPTYDAQGLHELVQSAAVGMKDMNIELQDAVVAEETRMADDSLALSSRTSFKDQCSSLEEQGEDMTHLPRVQPTDAVDSKNIGTEAVDPKDGENSPSNILDSINEKAISDDYKQSTPTENVQSTQRKKRKRAQTNSNQRKQPKRVRKSIKSGTLADENTTLSSPFTALGSLNAFMETRGIPTKRSISKSSYFTESKSSNTVEDKKPDDMQDIHTNQEKEKDIDLTDPKAATPQVPLIPETQGQKIIFLSTALLKTHLRVIRALERTHDSPALIYRDYENSPTQPIPPGNTTGRSKSAEKVSEADIIISPITGIILSTSQAMTQLYLPGHKPSNPTLSTIKAVNSPLRERIMCLAPRYECIYIFLCHLTPKKQSIQGLTTDKRTLSSLTSLTGFCNSLSRYSTITPLIIPSSPDTVTDWILALSSKHPLQLPDLDKSQNAFTPVNPSPKIEVADLQNETSHELYLRQAGLNPFAAGAVLGFLRREREELGRTHLRSGDAMLLSVGSLSRFIEMASDDRKRKFGGLVGERVLKRVECTIDKDWQCDWALDFDGNGG